MMPGSRVASHTFFILPQTLLAKNRTLLRFSLLSALAHIMVLSLLVIWSGGRARIQPPLQVITIDLGHMAAPQSRVVDPQAQKPAQRLPQPVQIRAAAAIKLQPSAAVPTQTVAAAPAKTDFTQGHSPVVPSRAGADVAVVTTPAPSVLAFSTNPTKSLAPPSGASAIRIADTTTIRTGYLQRCRTLIERHKEYPVMARKGMTEGTVLVRGTLAHDGILRQCSLIRGSGSGLLDNAALRAVRSVDRFPPLPSELQVGELVFELPVSFRLSVE
ncbi:MAG: TonB family protein [Pedobacter sp.]